MPRLARDFDDEAIREAERGLLAEVHESKLDDVGVLDDERLVLEELTEGIGYLFRRALEDAREHPC